MTPKYFTLIPFKLTTRTESPTWNRLLVASLPCLGRFFLGANCASNSFSLLRASLRRSFRRWIIFSRSFSSSSAGTVRFFALFVFSPFLLALAGDLGVLGVLGDLGDFRGVVDGLFFVGSLVSIFLGFSSLAGLVAAGFFCSFFFFLPSSVVVLDSSVSSLGSAALSCPATST